MKVQKTVTLSKFIKLKINSTNNEIHSVDSLFVRKNSRINITSIKIYHIFA
jgi:hypothetical protein